MCLSTQASAHKNEYYAHPAVHHHSFLLYKMEILLLKQTVFYPHNFFGNIWNYEGHAHWTPVSRCVPFDVQLHLYIQKKFHLPVLSALCLCSTDPINHHSRSTTMHNPVLFSAIFPHGQWDEAAFPLDLRFVPFHTIPE